MKLRFGTLLLILHFLFALSANRMWASACHDAEHIPEVTGQASCCTGQNSLVQEEHCVEASSFCKESHPGQPCPDEDDCGGCHCPGCGVMGACHASLIVEFPNQIPFYCDIDQVNRQAFYFAEHMPEAVYLPIWQPPKLGI